LDFLLFELNLGYIDEADVGSQTIFYTPIIDNSGFWKIDTVSAVVGGTVIQRAGNTGICDTGTTLCLVDSALCKAVYAQVPGAKYFPLFPPCVSFPWILIGQV
jgi:hypothetical protein